MIVDSFTKFLLARRGEREREIEIESSAEEEYVTVGFGIEIDYGPICKEIERESFALKLKKRFCCSIFSSAAPRSLPLSVSFG